MFLFNNINICLKNSHKFLFLSLFIITSTFLQGQNSSDCELYNRYSVKGTLINEKGTDYSIVITDHKNDTNFTWGIVNHCFSQHYHFAEFHAPNLYIIKRFPLSKSTFDDELWMISKTDSLMIDEGLGIDFRVNKQQTLVAYVKENLPMLYIKDLRNDSVREVKIDLDTLGFALIGMTGWANNDSVFWGSMFVAGETYRFFKYDYNTNKISYYPSPLNFLAEYSLNPDLGILLYSDFPFFVDVDSYNEFVKSGVTDTLYIYEFDKAIKKILKTNQAKEFDPEWICPDLYEYSYPEKDTRIGKKY